MQNHDTNEYLLVAYPDKVVLEKILVERQLFNETYDFKSRPSLKPHVLLTSFYASEGMESTLIRWLQRICGLEQGFTLTLNNYSGFPTHSIFLRVPNAGPLQNFTTQMSAMKDFIQPGVAGFFRRPHIAIATDLPATIYEQALSDYSRKLFHEEFPVKELVLLRRSEIANQFRTVQVFGLLPAGNDLFNKVA
jgi:hypothetical protein